jgi:hypothetical protein
VNTVRLGCKSHIQSIVDKEQCAATGSQLAQAKRLLEQLFRRRSFVSQLHRGSTRFEAFTNDVLDLAWSCKVAICDDDEAEVHNGLTDVYVYVHVYVDVYGGQRVETYTSVQFVRFFAVVSAAAAAAARAIARLARLCSARDVVKTCVPSGRATK